LHTKKNKNGRKQHFVYIVRCSNGDLYTGYTLNPRERVRQHNTGRGARFTRSRLPVELAYFEKFGSKSEALSREFAIKQLPRREKLLLITRAK